MRTLTTNYEFSHGCKPKGCGSWALKLTGTDNNGRFTTETYFETGTLTEAKAKAVKNMKSDIGGVKSITEIEVLP